MNKPDDDKEFAGRIARRLEDSAQGLDPHVTARLYRARVQALAQAGREKKRGRLWFPASLAGAAAACGLLLAVVHFAGPPPEPVAYSPVEDAEILGAADQLELFQDLDFYMWLADQQDGEFHEG